MEHMSACPRCGSEVDLSVMLVERGWWCAEVECLDKNDVGCTFKVMCGGDTKRGAISAAVNAWNIMNEEKK